MDIEDIAIPAAIAAIAALIIFLLAGVFWLSAQTEARQHETFRECLKLTGQIAECRLAVQ